MCPTSFLYPVAVGDQMPWVAYAVGAMLVAWVVIRPMLRRKDPLEKRPAISLSQQRSVEREMSHLLVELSEMARQITAQLDTRAAKLDLLLQEADEKIAALNRLSEAASSASAVEPAALDPPLAPEPLPRAASALDHRYQEIYHLADQGRSPHEIARQLDRPRGEIELILALRMK